MTTSLPVRPPSPPSQASRRHPAWADVPDSDWNDWRWQAQHAVRHTKQIVDLLPFTPEERRALQVARSPV